jgi:hypothetical protein
MAYRIFKILFLLLLVKTSAWGQEKFGVYTTSLEITTHDIKIERLSNGKFNLHINTGSTDAISKEAGIIVSSKRYEKFINALNEAKLKYEEWTNTAKANSVTDLTKKMDAYTRQDAFFYLNSERHLVYNIDLAFVYNISKNSSNVISYSMAVGSGTLKSSKNQFITNDGAMIIFASIEEINAFIDAISLDKINAHLATPNPNDLFKK